MALSRFAIMQLRGSARRTASTVPVSPTRESIQEPGRGHDVALPRTRFPTSAYRDQKLSGDFTWVYQGAACVETTTSALPDEHDGLRDIRSLVPRDSQWSYWELQEQVR